MRMREGLVVSLLLLTAAGWACGSMVVLWSEDFEGYDVGDLLPQDSTYSLTWNRTPEPTADISNTEPPWWEEDPTDNNLLRVVKHADTSSNHRGYLHKDLTGQIIAPSQTLVTVELDIYHRHGAGSFWGNEDEFRIGTADEDIVSLMINDAGLGARLNGEAIPGDAWTAWAWRHYRFDIDFDADTVALTIDDEAAPRLTVALPGDFSPGDISMLTFGAGMYYRANRTGESFFDNIVIHEIPEPATLSLLALGGLALWRRRK